MGGASMGAEKSEKKPAKSLVPAKKTVIIAYGGIMEPLVFLHGFSDTVLFELIKAVKKAAREAGVDPGLIAFASSTPTNLDWKIKDLIREVREEHRMMTEKKT
jgi:hypothetical protein